MRKMLAALLLRLPALPRSCAGCSRQASAHTGTIASTHMTSHPTARPPRPWARQTSDPRHTISRGTREAHRARFPLLALRCIGDDVVAPSVLRRSCLTLSSHGRVFHRPRSGLRRVNPAYAMVRAVRNALLSALALRVLCLRHVPRMIPLRGRWLQRPGRMK